MDRASKGFIKLDRAIFEHWIFQDAEKFKAFVDLIQLMRWKDETLILGNEIIVIPRGSYYTSELKLGERWGWSRKKVRAYLNLLQKEGMLIKKGTTKGTTLTIVNYEFYQGQGTTEGTTNGTKKATSGQRSRQLQGTLVGKNKIRLKKGTTKGTTSTLVNSDVQPSQGTTEGTSKEQRRNIKRTSKEHQKNNEGYTKEEVKEIIRIEKNREELQEQKEESSSCCSFPPEMDDNDLKVVAKEYENSGYGTIDGTAAEILTSLIKDYSMQWVVMALKEGVKKGKRNLGYAEGILKNWKADGIPNKNKDAPGKGVKFKAPVTTFNSYNQRSYDMKELEKKLLGRD